MNEVEMLLKIQNKLVEKAVHRVVSNESNKQEFEIVEKAPKRIKLKIKSQ